MRPIREAWLVPIEVTNHCPHDCAYCSRYVRHLRPDQRFHLSLEDLDKALRSCQGFAGKIGIIGGEPTLHPQFRELCELVASHYPREKCVLFTSHPELQDIGLMDRTFGFIAYHPRGEKQKECSRHQPTTLAVGDVAPSELIGDLIDDCWVQRTWCPNITPKGAFFCEIAGCLDYLLDGPGGWPVEPGWLDKDPSEYEEQRKRWCGLCGMPVPCEREPLGSQQEWISARLLKEFEAHGLQRLSPRWVRVQEGRFTPEEIRTAKETWYPGNYREDRTSDECSFEGKGATR